MRMELCVHWVAARTSCLNADTVWRGLEWCFFCRQSYDQSIEATRGNYAVHSTALVVVVAGIMRRILVPIEYDYDGIYFIANKAKLMANYGEW